MIVQHEEGEECGDVRVDWWCIIKNMNFISRMLMEGLRSMRVCLCMYVWIHECCDACIWMNECILESIIMHMAKSCGCDFTNKTCDQELGLWNSRTKPQLLGAQPQPPTFEPKNHNFWEPNPNPNFVRVMDIMQWIIDREKFRACIEI